VIEAAFRVKDEVPTGETVTLTAYMTSDAASGSFTQDFSYTVNSPIFIFFN
jgi:hypothetical protein